MSVPTETGAAGAEGGGAEASGLGREGVLVILGGEGMLGRALAAAAAAAGMACAAPRRAESDVREGEAVARALAGGVRAVPGEGRIGVVVNCAAATDVDACEREPERADALNRRAPERLARLCAERGIRLIHLSTDYVFDGSKAGGYVEADAAAPINVYGATKLAGERAVAAAHPGALVVRTSRLFGPGGRRNFVETMLRLAREQAGVGGAGAAERLRRPIEVIDDQWGSPTYAPDLAGALLRLVRETEAAGVLHAANAGTTTWYRFACRIMRTAGVVAEVVAGEAESARRAARRPANSTLDCGRLAGYGIRLRPWEEALAEYLRGRGGGGG
ncbi:MAG: dTDP-4-dehydrorhamnose reductase [Planctomycetes bacterium]|nr:dTDP-4-dehydrorhamnose reductase [Planctomycetota bacterium]